MRSFILAFMVGLPCLWSAPHRLCFSHVRAAGSLTVFHGRTPCGDHVRSFLQVPGTAACEMIRWELSLYNDEGSTEPARFYLKYTYGMNQPNSENFTGGGSASSWAGTWKKLQGTKADPDAVVYQLEREASPARLFLVRMDNDVIHLLYSDRSLLIGNAGYSYALYRVKN